MFIGICFCSTTIAGLRIHWLLPLYHPFHLASIIAYFTYIFVVPCGYFGIFHFRKNQDKNVKGLNEQKLRVRFKKNLVTLRFNLLIWFCEVISGIILFLPGSELVIKVTRLAYFTIPNTISPIFYYVGIELNRKELKKFAQSFFKDVQRKKSNESNDSTF